MESITPSIGCVAIGQTLASAHALADKDIVPYDIDAQMRDEASSSVLPSEISTFAFDHAGHVNLDWQVFVPAYNDGTPLC